MKLWNWKTIWKRKSVFSIFHFLQFLESRLAISWFLIFIFNRSSGFLFARLLVPSVRTNYFRLNLKRARLCENFKNCLLKAREVARHCLAFSVQVFTYPGRELKVRTRISSLYFAFRLCWCRDHHFSHATCVHDSPG